MTHPQKDPTLQAGFTLVEALVSIIVTTLMVLVITNYMMRETQTSVLETSRATMLRQTEQSLDLAAQDVRISAQADANNRNPDANSPGGSANQYGWSSSSSTLVLATAATDTSGNIIFSDPQNYVTTKNNIVYFVSNKTLYKRVLAASVANNSATTTCPASAATPSCPADKALLNNVSAFTVTYLDGQENTVSASDARSIKLAATVSSTQYNQTASVSYTTQMVFRND